MIWIYIKVEILSADWKNYFKNFLNEKSHKFAISVTTQICICLAI